MFGPTSCHGKGPSNKWQQSKCMSNWNKLAADNAIRKKWCSCIHVETWMNHDVEPGATFFEGTCQFILYLYSHTLTFSESSRFFSPADSPVIADSYIGFAKGTTFLDSSLSSPLQPSDQEIKWSISTCLGRHERPGHYGRCGWQHTSNWGRLLGSTDSTTSPKRFVRGCESLLGLLRYESHVAIQTV